MKKLLMFLFVASVVWWERYDILDGFRKGWEEGKREASDWFGYTAAVQKVLDDIDALPETQEVHE